MHGRRKNAGNDSTSSGRRLADGSRLGSSLGGGTSHILPTPAIITRVALQQVGYWLLGPVLLVGPFISSAVFARLSYVHPPPWWPSETWTSECACPSRRTLLPRASVTGRKQQRDGFPA
ncbi:hypothetical protein K470DRAFT_125021 [Piedraia hortae CBS 480.64]|uniref:Uncharacterized protein n=1 Tax=Piedraia hortae CBS 480.64 TaxID=1314780 RepID=A0A6A7C7L3_9PEZI|nr:hypothetical protein K470DRAFT_125021 [Piedraia hortae CBS 480.64]